MLNSRVAKEEFWGFSRRGLNNLYFFHCIDEPKASTSLVGRKGSDKTLTIVEEPALIQL